MGGWDKCGSIPEGAVDKMKGEKVITIVGSGKGTFAVRTKDREVFV